MSKSDRVPANVPTNVPAAGRSRASGPRYLTRDRSGWRFQIRIPIDLQPHDSSLARSRNILRARIGICPRKVAEQRADLLATLCQAVFAMARDNRETIVAMNAENDKENAESDKEHELLRQVVDACRAAIGSALANPAGAIGIAKGLEGALGTLKLVQSETEKGDAGISAIREGADGMVRSALSSVLKHATDPGAAANALAAVPNVSPQVLAPASATTATSSSTAPTSMPTFSDVSLSYIAMREAAVGADNREVKQHYRQRQLWLDIIGDRPVDQYYPRDLQAFVNAMKFWPRHASEIAEFQEMSNLEILAANRSLRYQPLGEASLRNKYVAFVKAMARHEMGNLLYRDPFAGAKIRYPDTAAPARPREEIGADIVNRTFELGVQSGCMDTAMLPALALLTSRRLGLLLYLVGSDIRQKNGVYVVQTNGILQVNGCWQRVPIKTAESMTYFVLHDFLAEIGFVDWAMRQDGWLFAQPHEHPDPSRYASKVLNRLLRQAGAVGQNVEVFHSLRGDAIDDLRDEVLDDRSRRLQAGHELGGSHESYGRKAIRIAECKRIAQRPLDPDVNWDILRGLDFDALSKGRRSRGRRKRG